MLRLMKLLGFCLLLFTELCPLQFLDFWSSKMMDLGWVFSNFRKKIGESTGFWTPLNFHCESTAVPGTFGPPLVFYVVVPSLKQQSPKVPGTAVDSPPPTFLPTKSRTAGTEARNKKKKKEKEKEEKKKETCEFTVRATKFIISDLSPASYPGILISACQLSPW